MKKFVRRPGYSHIVGRNRWHVAFEEERQFYIDSFRNLNLTVGECYALFSSADNLVGLCRITSRYQKRIQGTTPIASAHCLVKDPFQTDHDIMATLVDIDRVSIVKRGFKREAETWDFGSLSNYSHILQIDSVRFDVLVKQISMLNAQLNALQSAFRKEL